MNNIPRFGVAIDPKTGQIFYGDAGDDSGAISPKGYPYKWMQPGGPAESVRDGDRIRASGLEITDKSGYAYIDPSKLATLGPTDKATGLLTRGLGPIPSSTATTTSSTATTGQDDNPSLTRFRELINKAQGIQAESINENKRHLSLKQRIYESLAEAAFDPAVQKQQQDLIAKGAKIKADGIMGPLTQAAMKQFGGTAGKPELPSAGVMYGSLTPEEIAEGDKLFQSWADSQDQEVMNLLKQWSQIKNNQLKNIKPDPVNTNPIPPKPPQRMGWEAHKGQNTAGGAAVGNPNITAQGKKSGATQVPDVPFQKASGYKLTPQEAQNVLDNFQGQDLERYGGKAALQKLAAQKPVKEDAQLPMLTTEPTIARIVSLANHGR